MLKKILMFFLYFNKFYTLIFTLYVIHTFKFILYTFIYLFYTFYIFIL